MTEAEWLTCSEVYRMSLFVLERSPSYRKAELLHEMLQLMLSPAETADAIRCITGNPFRLVAFSSDWRTDTALALAILMYEGRDFSAMPILADALQDAGCDRAEVIDHCRGSGSHVRGCWVVDLVLGKE